MNKFPLLKEYLILNHSDQLREIESVADVIEFTNALPLLEIANRFSFTDELSSLLPIGGESSGEEAAYIGVRKILETLDKRDILLLGSDRSLNLTIESFGIRETAILTNCYQPNENRATFLVKQDGVIAKRNLVVTDFNSVEEKMALRDTYLLIREMLCYETRYFAIVLHPDLNFI